MQVRRASSRVLVDNIWLCIIRDIESIVDVYRRMNKIMSLGLDNKVRREAIEKMCFSIKKHYYSSSRRQPIIIDVGSGPGDSIEKIFELCWDTPGYVIAVDPSSKLLSNIPSSALCDKVVGVAENLPIRNKSVKGVSSFYAARDFKNLDEALQEFIRVIDNGVIAVGDIFLPDNIIYRGLVRMWICLIVPVLALVFATRRWRHYLGLCNSIRGWISAKKLKELLITYGDGGITSIGVKEFVLGGLGYVVARVRKAK
ncbi:class I SAM-dependent methyltransferase [Pyrofollis japonicus]|uniref:class I SAM-dependent methyltransferase n=1 Tax=Pyrofollis japonicus TaxID=3060460 RepID=UPI00295B6EE8|nr:class I SAM-dependent methyltransferase [Pyrofollis japonicus]